MATACAAVGAWLDQAGDEDRQLALEALQIEVTATPDRATVKGVLPSRGVRAIYLETCIGMMTCRCLRPADGLEEPGAGGARDLERDFAAVHGFEGVAQVAAR